VFLSWLTRRVIAECNRAQTAPAGVNSQLEVRVAARTRELMYRPAR
jgi:hypothetical protein